MLNKIGRPMCHWLMASTIVASMTHCCGAWAESVDVVSIEGGQVQGVATDVDGVQVFKGIPFAGPTDGENRFKPAQPVEPWNGVKKADAWGDQTMQEVNLNPPGGFWGDEFYYDPEYLPKASENGLNLNVFTPAKDSGDKLAVYMWIHGGGNDHGYASEMEFWAPKLAAKGIIVVPVQYRVGPFGFMALEELNAESPEGISGNLPLRDLITALKWIQNNIEGFGGDPSNVTIGGQSAGATNTITLLRSPMAKGLFHRAMIESTSTGFLPVDLPTLEAQAAVDAKAVEAVFGKPTTLADLRAVPAQDFIDKTAANADKSINAALNVDTKTYVIDGTYLTADSMDLLKPGALDGIDIMIGATSDERTSLVGKPDGTLTDEEFAANMSKAYGDGYKDLYQPSDPTNAYRLQLKAENDMRLARTLVSAEFAKANNDSNVYAFWFNHAPPGRNSEFYGSFHSSDLWYFFDSLRERDGQRHWTDADYRMADTMSSYLAHFVKEGNPNGGDMPEWKQPESGTAFMRFHDGYAYPVTSTPFQSRDALNRQTLLKTYDLKAPYSTQ